MKYTLEIYELHSCKYEVEADSLSEAIGAVINGEGDIVDNSVEYIETDTTRGLSAEQLDEDDFQDLLDDGMIASESDFVPSIRSFEVKED